jgi:polysaccharide biosynthesis transport protein
LHKGCKASRVMAERSRKPAYFAPAGGPEGEHRPQRKPQTADAYTDGSDTRPHASVAQADSNITGLRDMHTLVRRNQSLVLLAVLLSLGAGAVYLLLAPSRYIASATLIVDPAVSPVHEEYYIESQIQVMQSDAVARSVVEQLDLVEAGIWQDDEAFPRIRAAKRFVSWFVPALASDPDDGDPLQGAILTLRRNLTIARRAMTPVISISYNSTDPGRAADVVNTLVQAYTSHRRSGETAAAQQSIDSLTQRLNKLRLQLSAAERAVEDFKIANNIVGNGANQSLRAEQRLYDLSIPLDAARAATAQARARYESMQGVDEDSAGPEVRGALGGSETTVIQDRLPGAARQLAELHAGQEADAPRLVIPSTKRPNPEERQGAVEAHWKDDLDRAMKSQALLEKAFEEAAHQAKQVNQHRTRLRTFEASVETYRQLYGNMRQRYEETVQQGALPVNDSVQILIAARQPEDRSHPRPLLVFAFAGAFGLALGIGAAVVRERLPGGVAEA